MSRTHTEKNKKVIFIGGSSYSGSTMLDMMMANSVDSFSAGEVYALFRPFRPHHFNPKCGCSKIDCDFWLKVRQAGENNLYDTIFKLLPELSLIVDSSKNPWWIKQQTRLLLEKDIEVYNLLIWKEPALFAHSMHKRNRKGWKRAWKNYYRLYFTIIDNCITVPYCDLAQRPTVVLKDLCEKCGLHYHQDKEKFWQKKHHTLFGNDSAKIHLYSSKTNDYKQCRSILKESDDIAEHQTIYYDTNHLNSLPSDIKHELDTDTELHAIIKELNKEYIDRKGTICYSAVQLSAVRIQDEIKGMAGRLLGRYIKFL